MKNKIIGIVGGVTILFIAMQYWGWKFMQLVDKTVTSGLNIIGITDWNEQTIILLILIGIVIFFVGKKTLKDTF